jgi:hypothetical protein
MQELSFEQADEVSGAMTAYDASLTVAGVLLGCAVGAAAAPALGAVAIAAAVGSTVASGFAIAAG